LHHRKRTKARSLSEWVPKKKGMLPYFLPHFFLCQTQLFYRHNPLECCFLLGIPKERRP
jgi:hypothetical protein